MTETTAYPLTWELASLYPHPEQSAFEDCLQQIKMSLEDLVTRVAELSQSIPGTMPHSGVTF